MDGEETLLLTSFAIYTVLLCSLKIFKGVGLLEAKIMLLFFTSMSSSEMSAESAFILVEARSR